MIRMEAEKLKQLWLILAVLSMLAMPISGFSLFGSLKSRFMAVLGQAGYTIEALGHAGESIGEAISHLSRADISFIKMFETLFNINGGGSGGGGGHGGGGGGGGGFDFGSGKPMCDPNDAVCQFKALFNLQ